MSPQGVARALVGGLLLFSGDCHVEDEVSLLQSSVQTEPTTTTPSSFYAPFTVNNSSANAAGLVEWKMNDDGVGINFWKKAGWSPFGSKARTEAEVKLDASAIVRSLSWDFNASRTSQPKTQPELALTIQGRARLGNRLFQWAALVSIAKEAGAKVASPYNPKFNPESTPQLSKMNPLIWHDKEFEWLGKQKNKCHIWDRIPVKLDWNMENLSNFTLGGIPKGELQVQADGPPPERTQNWARTWADAITKTKTPTKCKIVELDGYWQSAEYFVHNLDMIRQLMWNEDTAVQAQVVLDGWLEREPPVGQLVGVHLRLGDYIGASRNLNMSYYREAFEAVKTARNDTQLTCLLFSDDIVLAQKVGEEFEACNKVIPAVPCPDPWNNKYHCHGREVGDWVQFYMMSQLDNLIIADSSYSFWSAVLSPNSPLVVVPNITWPLGVASRGDYAYLNNPLYGWVNIDAALGQPDSKAVREHLHLAVDRSAAEASEWAA
mmetsp:Transcript_110401/g.291499  ORF Transcript_110401/g.291499 Transcript_110401/m.291499 type:complete len:491 (+) Transcript_110401:75-1547(+)